MLTQGVPYHFTRYAVKGLLQVEKGDMHRLLFLAMLLYQEAGGVNGINGATASHEAALIAGKLDDGSNSSIDNSLNPLNAVRKQANRTAGLSQGPVACNRMFVFGLARRAGRFQWHHVEERTSPPQVSQVTMRKLNEPGVEILP
ncbi:unnamed protein product [Heligmosomoides polygyrus]|uniref:FERM domain-containing protein n=1 Tax=Heligmosomoides polygyrus TaxID=6339 RepID=A0A183GBQ1_HELPZ|nr:unnamed protein product [Heligmosomoides polygyrus]